MCSLGHELSLQPAAVPKPNGGVRKWWDVCLNGKPIAGSRHPTKDEAAVEMAKMQRVLGG